MVKAQDSEAQRLAYAAMQALSRGDKAAAGGLARQILLRRAGDPNAHQVLGVIALEAGDLTAARRHLEAANAAAPNQAQIVNTLGVALRRLGETQGARGAFARAGELGLIDGWRNLGGLEAKERNSKATIAAYERVLAISRRDPAAHAALAQEYERLHDLARAKAHGQEALAGDPGNEIARLALAHALLREKDFSGAEAAALAVTARADGAAANRAIAWGVVGEARDRLDDASGAFAAFTAANRILREQHGHLLNATHLLYHPAGLARMTELVGETDIAAWPAPAAAFATAAPVFLVGFPRSGTTLLDQILSSHSRIVCIEEREHFAEALGGVIRDAAKLARFGMLSAVEIDAARTEYWRRVRAENTLPPDALLVDKLPLNIVVLPLIKRVFPDARIVFALRDPRDVILSCYQQRFGMNAPMVQFLELGSAAAYYDAIMALFDVCRQRLALDLHQVRYEDVVADLEGAARGLTAFLGLDYETAMLDFNVTALKRDINTPSARQVIQPLYSRSIGRWRRYGEELSPVLPILAAWVKRFGYEP